MPYSDSFKNKVVVITGGTDGIGKALVTEFLKRGARVSTCSRTAEKLFDLSKELNSLSLLTVKADVSKESDCAHFIAETLNSFGSIDILINNAGISMRALFQETEMETLRRLMDVNFWGSVYCTKYALESVLKQKGSIVSVSSIAGYRGLPGRSGYSASKFALNGWMEALRTELLDSGVNVLWVCPGYTTSNIRNAALNKDAQPQGESPLNEGKLMSSEECALRIIKAIAKRKRTLVITFTGKETVWLNKFFPSLADRLTKKFFFKDGELIK
ncbi:MAG: SDR family oxidoreductase [Bacteroidetes bacterium]|nr:SDR family oxidoreductase [Bacteroidota bacterium]